MSVLRLTPLLSVLLGCSAGTQPPATPPAPSTPSTAVAATTPSRPTPSPPAPSEADLADDARPLYELVQRDINPGSPRYGETVAVKELLGHRQRVIVSFYASWCEPCFEELPVLAAANADPGTTVLMLGLDGDRVFSGDASPKLGRHREAAEASALTFIGAGDDPEAAYRLYLDVGYGIDEVAPLRELIASSDVAFSVPLTVVLDDKGAVARKTGDRLDEDWLESTIRSSSARAEGSR